MVATSFSRFNCKIPAIAEKHTATIPAPYSAVPFSNRIAITDGWLLLRALLISQLVLSSVLVNVASL
jgi:hypothetical protein